MRARIMAIVVIAMILAASGCEKTIKDVRSAEPADPVALSK